MSAQPYDLRVVLNYLVRHAREILGPCFVGAYEVGSFALGVGDEYSDVDFLIPISGELDPAQDTALAALHTRLPDSPIGWAQHLEGSYPPVDELRAVADSPRGWRYVDNGSRIIERSGHDDTAVTRWVLREHGIVLAGPPPRDLVDPISGDLLRTEAIESIVDWHAELSDDIGVLANAWEQQHTVLGFCRFLYTRANGIVGGKIVAGKWARENVDPQWIPLIDRAIADRPDPWGRVNRTVEPALSEQTWEFVKYVRAGIGR